MPNKNRTIEQARKFWRERTAEWRRKNPAKYLNYMRKWKKEHPEQTRSHVLKCRFGITETEYQALSQKQGGRCAICRKKEAVIDHRGKTRRLAIDHCHNSKKVRGLLCTTCNNGLGCFGDSVALMKSAIHYLTYH